MMLRALGLTAVLTATLAACASAPPESPGGRGAPPGEGGRAAMRGPQLFISPAGEPFRAPADAPYPLAAWFAGADANHDGALTRDEFVADAVRFFAVLDADRDGVIDGFEVSAYENDVAPEITGGVAPGSSRRGPRGQGPADEEAMPSRGRRPPGGNVLQGAALYGLIAEPEPVAAADADFNRRITRDEMIKASKLRFALLDRDRDGVLKLAELPQTPAQRGLRPGMGGRGRGGGGEMGGRPGRPGGAGRRG